MRKKIYYVKNTTEQGYTSFVSAKNSASGFQVNVPSVTPRTATKKTVINVAVTASQDTTNAEIIIKDSSNNIVDRVILQKINAYETFVYQVQVDAELTGTVSATTNFSSTGTMSAETRAGLFEKYYYM
ncbi:MAG: hypothetical protein QXN77_08145 [Candidatus Caldarchaeum sp.]